MANTAAPGLELTREQLAEAHANVSRHVDHEAFFQKLASFNIIPQTQEDVNYLLHIRAHAAQLPNEQPQPSNSPFGKVAMALDAVAAQHTSPMKQAHDARTGAYAAAQRLLQDPTMYRSVLTLKMARAMNVQ